MDLIQHDSIKNLISPSIKDVTELGSKCDLKSNLLSKKFKENEI